ncbi:Metallo-peptidase family M12-domain-containing protein [Zychaea mexicana]|uniref:Metallo-peptidase family M12-domain-containing protein n=1 Tax=Zychaea mexicana TaxID=64656 RepID=UPI0022FE13A8|nr:Metallo-peptidase family M12-domain-containing protein [Zychaea mexicana]KAI9488177.1 Metallo-peptidase family M12-domain-containing protein [Zychaea mexicana]
MILSRFLIVLVLLCGIGQISSHSVPAERISRIEPLDNPEIILHHHTTKQHSPATTIKHSDSFTLRFTAFDTRISLHLTPNHDLFHPDATTLTYGHGERRRKTDADNDDDDDDDSIDDFVEEALHPHDHRIFKGVAEIDDGSTASGWARITIVRDDDEHPYPYPLFEGAFMLASDIYHIKTTTNFHLSKRDDDPIPSSHAPMVIYRDSDMQQPSSIRDGQLIARSSDDDDADFMCSMEEMQFNQKLTGMRNTSSVSPLHANIFSLKNNNNDNNNPHHFTKRFNPLSGCPSTRKIAYMGAVADCTYVQSYGSIRFARLQIINDWNVASAVYERTFNISLGLIYIQMSQPECPRHPSSRQNWNQECSSFYSINDRLSDFSLWRGKRGDDGAALWHLMTKCSTGVKVGIAWLSQLCESQVSQQIEENGASEWVSGTGVSSITRDEWKVVAHEIGHGFGAIHDCTAQTCPCSLSGCSCCPLSDSKCSAGDTYLMNPTSNVTSEDFSPCSISDICGSFPNIGYCLQSPDLRDTTSFTMCGNGILEPGEECDSGLTDSACCHAKTCKLKTGAVCDDYSQQCCLNCTVAPSTAMCRPAVSECDIPEYCTGESTSCPADVYQENRSACANNTMNCASGVCTSRDEQCIARGMRLGVTEECSFQKDSCLISCADPLDPGNCLVLSGVFLDGTGCGLASICEKGACVSTGALNTLKAWVAQNKQIAIPVFLFGSLIILGLLGWLAWFIISRYRRNRLASKDKDSRPSSIANTSSYQLDDMGGMSSSNNDNGGGGGGPGTGGEGVVGGGPGNRQRQQSMSDADTAITIRRTQQQQSTGFHDAAATSAEVILSNINNNNNSIKHSNSTGSSNHHHLIDTSAPAVRAPGWPSESIIRRNNNNATSNNDDMGNSNDNTWRNHHHYPASDTHSTRSPSHQHRYNQSEGSNYLPSLHPTETTATDSSLHGSTSTARRIGFHQGKQHHHHEMAPIDYGTSAGADSTVIATGGAAAMAVVDIAIASEGQRHRRAKSTGA